MGLDLATIQAQVDYLIPGKDTNQVSAAAQSALIEAVSYTFSKDFPQELVADTTCSEGQYDFTLPTDWEEGVSSVLRVEYPADTGNTQEVYWLEPSEYFLYKSASTTTKLRLKETSASAGDKLRIHYSASHVWSGTTTRTSTVSAQNLEQYSFLAAARIAEAFAAWYAKTTQSSISADSVDYQSITQKWKSIAKGFMEEYNKAVTKSPVPAVARVDIDFQFAGSRNTDFLTHPKEFR